MKMTAKFEAEGESFNACFEQLNSAFNAEFSASGGGQDGKDGATFTPYVSEDGVISWTNDRGLPNPSPVNIKGEKGDKGDKGERGLQGIQGIQGERGTKGDKGDKGDRGEQGIQGVQGIKGKTGAQGQRGADGTPATHRWSGTTLYITSASGTSSANLKGDKGDKGKDGYTPVKGKDYLTYTDKQEMVNAVISALPKYNGEVAAE